MKEILIICGFCLILSSAKAHTSEFHFESDSVYLILDEPYNDSLPRNFRKCDGGFERMSPSMPDTAGLSGLNISGSAEFSGKNLPAIINAINKKQLIVFDLRQETHGFLNGMAVSWYGKYDWANVNLTRDEVIDGETNTMDSIGKMNSITIMHVLSKDKTTNSFKDFQDINIDVKTSQTEEELTKSFNIEYYRITATDHRRPVDADVDRFVNYITSLNGDHWIHFHCHAGDGRTTTFMVMYDMMKNAKSVAFDDIIKRQYLLGGIDLSSDEDFPAFDKKYAIDRTKFLKKFYDYCKKNNDGYRTSYTEWISISNSK